MKAILLNAKTSKIHTNHCIRATCVTALQKEGYTPNDIMALTGHQNTHLLMLYCRPSDKQQREMAEVLDRCGIIGNEASNVATASTPPAMWSMVDHELESLSNVLWDGLTNMTSHDSSACAMVPVAVDIDTAPRLDEPPNDNVHRHDSVCQLMAGISYRLFGYDGQTDTRSVPAVTAEPASTTSTSRLFSSLGQSFAGTNLQGATRNIKHHNKNSMFCSYLLCSSTSVHLNINVQSNNLFFS